MAIPTISSITPVTGPTRGGNLITINGTGFREPTSVQTGSGSVDAVPTVLVEFDGIPSEYAHSVTDIKAIAKVPQWRGDPNDVPKKMTVRLANFDDNLVEIPGETVDAVDAYTVTRPVLTVAGLEVRVIEQFLLALRRHVHPNIWFTTERFIWDESEGVPDKIRTAQLPLIHVNGVSMDDNEHQQNMGGQHVETSPETEETFDNGTAVDLMFASIDIYSKASGPHEIFSLGRAFVKFAEVCPFVRCTPEPWDVGSDDYEFPLTIPTDGVPDYQFGPSLDGLKKCRTAAIIEGVELNDPVELPTGWTKDWIQLGIDFQPS